MSLEDLDSTAKVEAIRELVQERKALDVLVLDLRGLTLVADYFLLCSGRTPLQVRAIADAIRVGMDELRVGTRHTEGVSRGRWALLDYGDVVVHIFHQEDRDYYGLERLWGDAPELDDPESTEVGGGSPPDS